MEKNNFCFCQYFYVYWFAAICSELLSKFAIEKAIFRGVLRGVSAKAEATSRTSRGYGKRVCVRIGANPLSVPTTLLYPLYLW